MTARKTRQPQRVTTEVKPGTGFQPPQARGGMMKVAGATDSDLGRKGKDLITDEDEMFEVGGDYGEDKSINGPAYDEPRNAVGPSEGIVRLNMSQLREVIRRLWRKA
jgi:hypothetical protein